MTIQPGGISLKPMIKSHSEPVNPKFSPVPNCPYCGKKMSRTNTQAGRGLFSCTDRFCFGSKRYFRRDGTPR